MSSPRKLVGITQRVVKLSDRGERRDVLDQAWTSFLSTCGFDILPISNRLDDPVDYLTRVGVDAIILSGGGNVSNQWRTISGKLPAVQADLLDLATERDKIESKLLNANAVQGWPLIGVCRGMQFINLFHDGFLKPVKGHVGVYHKLVTVEDCFSFGQRVNSFHDFGVPLNGLGRDVHVLAETDGYAEAILNRRAKHLGIMWHPERNFPWSKEDVILFSNFLSERTGYE